MAHFYEIIKNQGIDFRVEFQKLFSLASVETRYYHHSFSSDLFSYLNVEAFRKIRLSYNFTDIGSYVMKIKETSTGAEE